MAVEQEQALPTTTQGSGEMPSALMTVLRWVYPRGVPVTVLAETAVVIGRDPSSQVRLDTSRVSRRHAEIRQIEGRPTVRDLDSKNGVHLNGKRVSQAALARGDVLRVGNFVAVVESATAADLPGFRELGYGVHGGAALSRAFNRAQSLASSREPILFEGELGTGKELVARAVHRASNPRASFMTLRAEGLEAHELEAALAAGGTLYVDGVPLLAPDLQAKLLDALERPGAGRLLLSSRTPLSLVPTRRLSIDLRARVEERVVSLPPLRERRADIVPLFQKFLRAEPARPTLEHELVERLCLASWPLNVLELEGLAERFVALGPELPELKLADLADVVGPGLAQPAAPEGSVAPARRASVYPPEQIVALKEAIERHGGNITKAANELGITRPKAYRMLDGSE